MEVNGKLEQHCRTTGPKTFTECSVQQYRTHILHKSTWNTLQIDHMLDHTESLNTYKLLKLYNGMKFTVTEKNLGNSQIYRN